MISPLIELKYCIFVEDNKPVPASKNAGFNLFSDDKIFCFVVFKLEIPPDNTEFVDTWPEFIKSIESNLELIELPKSAYLILLFVKSTQSKFNLEVVLFKISCFVPISLYMSSIVAPVILPYTRLLVL